MARGAGPLVFPSPVLDQFGWTEKTKYVSPRKSADSRLASQLMTWSRNDVRLFAVVHRRKMSIPSGYRKNVTITK